MAQSGYYLTPETYQELMRVINLLEPGFSGGGGGSGGASRYLTFCIVTGGTENPYTATVIYWDSQFSEMRYGDVILYEVNNSELQPGRAYFATRTGWDGNTPVFLTSADGATIDCNLKYDDYGNIVVDVDSLAGDGMEVQPPSSGRPCPSLRPRLGCGLAFDLADAIAVDVEAIAGPGLTGDPDYCTLGIDIGCGLTTGLDGEIEVNPTDIAGPGLSVGSGCQVQVNTGCGLTLDSGQVRVSVADLAGDGLEAGSGCSLQVRLCTDTFTTLTGITGISISGTTITLDYTTATYGLQMSGGAVCLVQQSTGTGTAAGSVPCTTQTVVTAVSCGDGGLSVTTGDISFVPC